MPPLARRRARQGHDQAQLEVGLDPQAGPDLRQDVLHQRLRFGDVALLVFRSGQPVAGDRASASRPRRGEDLGGLRSGGGCSRRPDRGRQAPRPARPGAQPESPSMPAPRAAPDTRRQPRPVTGSQLEVHLEATPRRGLVGKETAGRKSQAIGQEVQGGHRGLRVAGLERADIGLRVAVTRERLLRQARGEARVSQALADSSGQRAVVNDDPAALLEGCAGCPGGACRSA